MPQTSQEEQNEPLVVIFESEQESEAMVVRACLSPPESKS